MQKLRFCKSNCRHLANLGLPQSRQEAQAAFILRQARDNRDNRKKESFLKRLLTVTNEREHLILESRSYILLHVCDTGAQPCKLLKRIVPSTAFYTSNLNKPKFFLNLFLLHTLARQHPHILIDSQAWLCAKKEKKKKMEHK